MPFCKRCGASVNKGDTFCTKCGASLAGNAVRAGEPESATDEPIVIERSDITRPGETEYAADEPIVIGRREVTRAGETESATDEPIVIGRREVTRAGEGRYATGEPIVIDRDDVAGAGQRLSLGDRKVLVPILASALVVFIAAVVIVAVVGLGGGGETSWVTEAVIGPEGGVVEVVDAGSPINGLRLEIPEGALDEKQSVTVSVAGDDQSFGIGPVLELGPDGLSSNEPIRIVMPYDNLDLAENNIIDESLLSIYHLNEEMGLWVKDGESVVDPDNNVVSSTITHFSQIATWGAQLINVNAAVDSSDTVPDRNRQQVLLLHGVQIPFHEFWNYNEGDLWRILTFKGSGYGNYEDTFGCLPLMLAMDTDKGEKKYQVWAVHYDSWAPIENNGQMLWSAISKIKSELGDPNAKVSIIAHSMGGLVARWHVQRVLYPGGVSKIMLIGSPNHGARLADGMDYMLDALRDRIADALGHVPWVGTILSALYSSLVDFAPSFEQLSPDSDFLADLNNASLRPIPSDVFIFNVYTDNLQLLGIPFTSLGDGVVPYQSALLNEFDSENILDCDLQDYWHIEFSLLGWDKGVSRVDCIPQGHETWTLVNRFLADRDEDGFPDEVDNCPDTPNPNQADSDGDGIGDACDTDTVTPKDRDGDGIHDSVDNCPDTYNPDQADSDGDGIGDACETDAVTDLDGDGIHDSADNCPDTYNPDQADSDGDGIGDACDTDTPDDHPEWPDCTNIPAPPASDLSSTVSGSIEVYGDSDWFCIPTDQWGYCGYRASVLGWGAIKGVYTSHYEGPIPVQRIPAGGTREWSWRVYPGETYYIEVVAVEVTCTYELEIIVLPIP